MARFRARNLEQVLTHVDVVGECWVWRGGKTVAGYPFGRVETDKVEYIHRYVCRKVHGLEPHEEARHGCDNPPCIRPEHLMPGGRQDNVDDCVARGRHPRGETNGHSKLTEIQVREIRARAASGEKQKPLAAEYGVRRPLISKIVLRERWAHVV